MGWFVGAAMASLVAAFIVVKIFDQVFAGVTGSVASVARAGLFVGTWTAVTARAGMLGFNKRIRDLRQGNQKAIKALIEKEGGLR